MDKKVELQVINITNSQAQIGAFAMLLGEVDGERQLPIIIGPAEAQATALYLKGVKTPRPLTHDLFITSLTVLGASLIRVLIYKAKDGIFCSYIYLKKDNEIIRIDARTSDAIALGEERTRSGQINDEGISLEEALQQAIKEEDYELAARIRDQINSRNNNQ